MLTVSLEDLEIALTNYSYVPGWDCHGLPIEQKALEQLDVDHRTLTPLEIRKAARKTAHKAIAVQKKEFQEFGLMADWDNIYRTFDTPYAIRQLKVFQEMAKRGKTMLHL